MAKTPVKIAFFYTLFSAVSTIINIGAQMLSIWVYKGLYSVELSILVGTAAGLPLRYLLEKNIIFAFKSKNMAHEKQLFFFYSLMSMFTTAIFCGVEYAFHIIFVVDTMRYIGGVIGLAIGFYVKYHLDKKYVFVSDIKQVAK